MTDPGVALEEARAYLELYHRETGRPGLCARLREVEEALVRYGRYTQDYGELSYGARVAWRNAVRCVGRAYWRYLDVFDMRHLESHEEVFAALVAHLRSATNGGNIRPTVTVFHPDRPIRVLNDQLIRYAGYRRSDGSVLGDPRNLELTARLQALGWRGGPGTAFDVLPLAIRVGKELRLFELPPDAVLEVLISHPEFGWFAELGLRWHAVPVISNMRLEVGGVSYRCAPFNGWYVETEIAARNLADEDRYNLLPEVARRMGLRVRGARSLWRDRALIELHAAVLHSFDAAGVKISDHHTVSEHFVRFEAREAREGREVKGRWSWLVPPISGSTSPIFHRRYDDLELKPNFFAPEDTGGCPVH
nr:nitric oxide synthase oxygenase [Deinobacterium chartae]